MSFPQRQHTPPPILVPFCRAGTIASGTWDSGMSQVGTVLGPEGVERKSMDFGNLATTPFTSSVTLSK